jgi:hypothetical protein
MSDIPNYVIAISSVSGGGKTTLVKRTVDQLKGTAIFFDDYASVSEYPSDLKKWVEDGADVNEWKTPQFAQDLAALKRGESIVSPKDGTNILPSPYIVIEEPLGRNRLEMAHLIDFMAVIETPLEIALTRRLLRDYIPSSTDEFEKSTREELATILGQIVTNLRGFLVGYLDIVRDIYITVHDQAKQNCDLVLDGCRPVDELVQELVNAVKDKQKD